MVFFSLIPLVSIFYTLSHFLQERDMYFGGVGNGKHLLEFEERQKYAECFEHMGHIPFLFSISFLICIMGIIMAIS